ncbi:hypothetical protein [uncultured Sphingomonas sp.]|uniref:hypothetical protein n=1 Tax=uncultured Sphingomonas sp. TaxID=158754 RepID=UPI0035CA99FB
MKTLMTKAVLGATLAATALTAAAPADAQRYRRGRGGDDTGTAIVAGVAGLAIGAAIASNGRRDYDRERYYRQRGYAYDYDTRFYRDRGYYPNDGYYAYRYRDRYDRCRIERRFDSYSGRPVRVRVCY